MIDWCSTTVKMGAVGLCSSMLIACTPTVIQSLCPDTNQPIESSPHVQDAEHGSLLSYYNHINNSTERVLQKEHRLVLSRKTTERGSRDQLRLAVVLSRPDTPLSDDQHAQLLIEDYLESSVEGHEDDKAFAQLLLSVLEDRQRYGRSKRKVEEALNKERERRNDLKTKSDQLEVEIVKLKAQLNQLKAIEDDITESEQSIVAPLPENQQNGK